MARLVFVAVFLAAVSAAADAQPLRYPFNGHLLGYGAGRYCQMLWIGVLA